jgi:hypothetical protein
MADASPFDDETFELLSLQNAAYVYVSEKKKVPDDIIESIDKLSKKFKQRTAQVEVSNAGPMANQQVETFWDQVYAFSILNQGIAVPEEPLPALEELRKDAADEDVVMGYEDMYPDTSIVFTRWQKMALEFFNVQVSVYGRFVPVPDSVRRRLRVTNRLSPEEDDIVGYYNADMEAAVCNCPYCWLYTEDMTTFMDHLWEKHAVLEQSEEDLQIMKDSGYESMMEGETGKNKPEGREVEVETTNAIPPPSPRPTLRRLAVLDQDRTAKSHGVRPMKHDTLGSPLKRKEVSNTTAPATPGRTSTRSMDTTFWKNLLTPPQLSGPNSPISQPCPERARQHSTASLISRINVQEQHAQKIRDSMDPIPRFDPYTRGKSPAKRPGSQLSPRAQLLQKAQSPRSPPHPDGVFKLPAMPASEMRKGSSPSTSKTEESSPDFQNEYLIGQRYWICVHDEDCKKKFKSLVLFIEHLGEHGFIVYYKLKELHSYTVPGLKDMRISWNVSGL